jgi:hypothetical protein
VVFDGDPRTAVDTYRALMAPQVSR